MDVRDVVLVAKKPRKERRGKLVFCICFSWPVSSRLGQLRAQYQIMLEADMDLTGVGWVETLINKNGD
jgi:hypothetical protein